MAIIAVLDSASPVSRGKELDAFFSGLASAGIDGDDTKVLFAWANNVYSRLPGLAEQLANDSEIKVIVAAGGPISAIEAKKKTTTKPIVFTTVTDPVASGLVQSLSAPGGNATGTWGKTTELDEARLRALCDLTGSGTIGILANPARPFPVSANATEQRTNLEAKATAFGRSAVVVDAFTDSEIDAAFSAFQGNIAGLLVTADPFFNSRRERVLELAENLAVPAIFQWSGFVTDGGLMSYGTSKEEGYFNAGEYAGRIVKNNEQPADLPVREANSLSLFVNANTANSLNVNPSSSNFSLMVSNLGVTTINNI